MGRIIHLDGCKEHSADLHRANATLIGGLPLPTPSAAGCRLFTLPGGRLPGPTARAVPSNPGGWQRAVAPSSEQFTSSAGRRVPVPHLRGLFSSSGSVGRYRVIGDLPNPAASIYVNSNFGPGVLPPTRSFIVWLPWPQLYDPLRAQLV